MVGDPVPALRRDRPVLHRRRVPRSCSTPGPCRRRFDVAVRLRPSPATSGGAVTDVRGFCPMGCVETLFLDRGAAS